MGFPPLKGVGVKESLVASRWSIVAGRRAAVAGLVFGLFLTGALARPASAQQIRVLVVTGVAGDDERAKTFHKWATTFIDAAKKRDGVPDANITYLGDKPDADPKNITGRSTRESVEKTVAALAAQGKPDDQIFILLIGHGSFDGRQGAFNLPGPDLTATDWAALLGKLAAQRVVFVNTSSASGAFLAAVAGPGRTIVTATKTGGERNETMFGQFFVEAFADEAADRDRNGSISVAEAFDYANTNVVKAFEQAGNLRTEHATLDDGTEGKLAATMFLAANPGSLAAKVDTSDPEMRALVAEVDAVNRKIADLKVKKDLLPAVQYDAEMEKLLTDLAFKAKAVRDLQAKKERK